MITTFCMAYFVGSGMEMANSLKLFQKELLSMAILYDSNLVFIWTVKVIMLLLEGKLQSNAPAVIPIRQNDFLKKLNFFLRILCCILSESGFEISTCPVVLGVLISHT